MENIGISRGFIVLDQQSSCDVSAAANMEKLILMALTPSDHDVCTNIPVAFHTARARVQACHNTGDDQFHASSFELL